MVNFVFNIYYMGIDLVSELFCLIYFSFLDLLLSLGILNGFGDISAQYYLLKYRYTPRFLELIRDLPGKLAVECSVYWGRFNAWRWAYFGDYIGYYIPHYKGEHGWLHHVYKYRYCPLCGHPGADVHAEDPYNLYTLDEGRGRIAGVHTYILELITDEGKLVMSRFGDNARCYLGSQYSNGYKYPWNYWDRTLIGDKKLRYASKEYQYDAFHRYQAFKSSRRSMSTFVENDLTYVLYYGDWMDFQWEFLGSISWNRFLSMLEYYSTIMYNLMINFITYSLHSTWQFHNPVTWLLDEDIEEDGELEWEGVWVPELGYPCLWSEWYSDWEHFGIRNKWCLFPQWEHFWPRNWIFRTQGIHIMQNYPEYWVNVIGDRKKSLSDYNINPLRQEVDIISRFGDSFGNLGLSKNYLMYRFLRFKHVIGIFIIVSLFSVWYKNKNKKTERGWRD